MVARRLWLAVPTPLLCVLCAFGPPRALARIISDRMPARVATRTLHLQNSSWSQVKVEVRLGPSTTCDAFASLGVQVLQQGQEWELHVDDPLICWRRDQTPGNPASTWSAWHQVKLADAEIRVVTL